MCLFRKMPPFGGAFAQQRPILTPIGELLPVEGACVTGFPSCCINHAEHSAELAATRPPPIRLHRTPPQKGETTHYILRVAIAPSSTAVTDSLDFQVADAPLQIQFASAKCVRCAIHGKASHVTFGSLSLPYKLRSLATLFRGENRPLYAFL